LEKEEKLMYSLKNNLQKFVWEAHLGTITEGNEIGPCLYEYLIRHVYSAIRVRSIIALITPIGTSYKEEGLLVLANGLCYMKRRKASLFINYLEVERILVGKGAVHFIEKNGKCHRLYSDSFDLTALAVLFTKAKEESHYWTKNSRLIFNDLADNGYKYGNPFFLRKQLWKLWETQSKELENFEKCFRPAVNFREKKAALSYEITRKEYGLYLLKRDLDLLYGVVEGN